MIPVPGLISDSCVICIDRYRHTMLESYKLENRPTMRGSSQPGLGYL